MKMDTGYSMTPTERRRGPLRTVREPVPIRSINPRERIADIELGQGPRLRTLTAQNVALVVEATGTETARALWGRTRPALHTSGRARGAERLGFSRRTPGVLRRYSSTTACSVPWG
jgi:hypothetical protein